MPPSQQHSDSCAQDGGKALPVHQELHSRADTYNHLIALLKPAQAVWQGALLMVHCIACCSTPLEYPVQFLQSGELHHTAICRPVAPRFEEQAQGWKDHLQHRQGSSDMLTHAVNEAQVAMSVLHTCILTATPGLASIWSPEMTGISHEPTVQSSQAHWQTCAP